MYRGDLEGAWAKQEKALGKGSAAVQKELRRFFARYIKETKAILADVQNVTKTKQIRLVEIDNIMRQLQNILPSAGYGDVLREYKRQLGKVSQSALDYYKDLGISAKGGIDADALDMLGSRFGDQLSFQVDAALIRPMEQTVMQSMLFASDRATAVSNIIGTIDREGVLRKDGTEWTSYNVEVFVQDSQRRFQQYVSEEKAKDLDLEVRVYVGPLDNRTRDVCRELIEEAPHGVPGMWLLDEIGPGMVEDADSDVLVECGGYNCRHKWMPLAMEDAKAQGFTE